MSRASERHPRDPTKPNSPARVGRIVAVIDDDEAVCDSTQILLEAHGLIVRTFSSAAAFLKEEPAVSCIVVDYHMPGMNGLELVSHLKGRGSSVPVIMITATADSGVEARSAELGIKRVLKKPLGNTLLSAVEEELGRTP